MANRSEQNIIEQVPARFHSQSVLPSQLDEIALHLEDWELLAPFIKISSPEVKEISENYSGNYRLQKRQALRIWRQKCEHKATIKELVCILYQQGLRSLAEKIVEICKKEWPTSIIVFSKYLCSYYNEGLAHPSNNQWPSVTGFELPQTYVDLTLHEVPISEIESVLGQMDANKYKEIELHSIFKPSSSRMVILFEGVGGSGKTTLAWYACKEWAAGRLLQQFQLLIHVQLNDPRLRKLKNLELKDLIPDPDTEACNEIATAIMDRKGERVCLLLEGLDETPEHLRQPLLSHVLEGRKLRHLSIIMTTRPHGKILLSLQRVLSSRILIKGFDREKLGKFLDFSLGANSDEKATLVHKFEINPQLEALASLPINAVILSFLVKYFKDELPVTQTGLFNLFMCHACIRHLQLKEPDRQQFFVSKLPYDLPSGLKEAFQNLCLLAYELSRDNKRLFCSVEVGKVNNTLGLLQLQQNVSMFGLREYYSFPHLSLQQFLTAIHLSQMKERDQTLFVSKLLNQDPLSHVIPFFAGLTCLENRRVLSILAEALKHVSSCITVMQELLSSNCDPRRKALTLINSLYESQDERLIALHVEVSDDDDSVSLELCKQANIQETPLTLKVLTLQCLPLTPRDCLSLGYFGRIKSFSKCRPPSYVSFNQFEHILAFNLCSCSLGDTGILALTTELRKNIDFFTPVRIQLLLSYNQLNQTSLQSIKALVSGVSNTESLDLGICLNPQTVDLKLALKLLIEGLHRSTCRQLDISQNYFNVLHIHYLLLLLRSCLQLRWLSMKSFNLRKLDAMRLFCEALKLSSLNTVDLTSCGITDSGLAELGKAVSRNDQLVHLRMFENNFGDRALAEFLQLFLYNFQSTMTFLGVKMNDVHKKILEEINRFRKAFNMSCMTQSYEGVSDYENELKAVTALNTLHALNLKDDEARKQFPSIVQSIDQSFSEGLQRKYI